MNYKENLEQQLAEVELLSSMYPGEGEMVLDMPTVINDVTRYISGERQSKPKQIAFTLKLLLDSGQDIFLSTSFPATYPSAVPEVFARCSQLTRQQQALLNQHLSEYLQEQTMGEPSITSAIMWLQENAPEYIESGNDQHSSNKETTAAKLKFTGLSRLWIYSHHIYRKELLKKIPDSAAELDLTGFVLPGKPGIICVEGFKERCDEYWQRLKYPNWKHISCKHREDKELKEEVHVETQLEEFRIFKMFEELAFEAHGDYGLRNDYHMDLGQFRQYLKSHNCEFIFQIFFGFEGK